MKQLRAICMMLVFMLVFSSCSMNPFVAKDELLSIDEIISNMTLEEKVGQLFLFSINGDSINDEIINFLQASKAGNIILYTKNIKDSNQLIEFNKSLQENIINTTKVPALIGIDQEGGSVNRIFQGATFFPGAMAFSAAGDPSATYKQGQYMGEELKALGIHINFAPVADININPKNPVVGTRAYGDDYETVSAYSSGLIKGLQEQNVIACAKHFPGHGDTTVDSHTALPTIDKSLDDLKQAELKPFQNAIASGVDAIMTAHISFPQIETENLPSTLSKTFLTDILRNQLGFNGLIITDSLEMKAIKNQYSMGDAAVMAINAGANLIIIGSGSDSNYFDHLNAYYSVLTAVKNGTIPYETLYNSVKLILEYKEKYKVLENPYPMDSIDSIDYSLHKSFAQQVSLKSITLIQDKRNLLPITSDTLVISNLANIPLGIDQNDSQAKNSIAYILAKKIGSNYMTLPSNPTSDNIQSFVSKAKEYDKVIIATYMANSHYEAITSIARANPNTILLLLGSPYDLSMFTNISTIICAYEYTPLSTESLIKVLTGEAEAMGRLPVELE